MKPLFAGLNLCENTITDRGISIIVDRCLQVNDTLPIVSVKGPGIYSGEMYFNVESTSFIVIPWRHHAEEIGMHCAWTNAIPWSVRAWVEREAFLSLWTLAQVECVEENYTRHMWGIRKKDGEHQDWDSFGWKTKIGISRTGFNTIHFTMSLYSWSTVDAHISWSSQRLAVVTSANPQSVVTCYCTCIAVWSELHANVYL